MGIVVADEALAARAGTDILAEGGSAADAATATYFALAVTYPVAAGLGGGGLCLVREASGKSEEFDFPAGQPRSGGNFGIPANVSGFNALQQAFGKLAWSRDMVPAEKLASLGFSIPAHLEQRLASAENLIRLDASLAAEFLDESGQLRPVGSPLVLPELAETLARIRTDGVSGLARGAVGAHIVNYSSAEGGSITADDLVGTQVVSHSPASLTVHGGTALLPEAASGAAAFVSAALLSERNGAAAQAIDQSATAGGDLRDDGATSFVAMDGSGQVVTCALTMNGAFGAGRTVPATGITLAHASSPSSAALLAPLIKLDANRVALVGAAAGNEAAQGALAKIVLEDTNSSHAIAPPGTLNMIDCTEGPCRAIAYGGGVNDGGPPRH